jgi:Uma2 family endonuclease
MTWPDHLLSLSEWDALPEDVSRRFELAEGVLQMSPRPTPAHQRVVTRLLSQLNPQWGRHGLEAVPEADLVLVADYPPLLRAPDIVVTEARTLDTRPARLTAADARLVIEVVSPGSARIDRVAKFAEYAEAGIARYWIVDIADPATLSAFTLVEATYQAVLTEVTGTVHLDSPAPVMIDLAALLS